MVDGVGVGERIVFARINILFVEFFEFRLEKVISSKATKMQLNFQQSCLFVCSKICFNHKRQQIFFFKRDDSSVEAKTKSPVLDFMCHRSLGDEGNNKRG